MSISSTSRVAGVWSSVNFENPPFIFNSNPTFKKNHYHININIIITCVGKEEMKMEMKGGPNTTV